MSVSKQAQQQSPERAQLNGMQPSQMLLNLPERGKGSIQISSTSLYINQCPAVLLPTPNVLIHLWFLFKGAVRHSNAIQFLSDSANIFSQSVLWKTIRKTQLFVRPTLSRITQCPDDLLPLTDSSVSVMKAAVGTHNIYLVTRLMDDMFWYIQYMVGCLKKSDHDDPRAFLKGSEMSN